MYFIKPTDPNPITPAKAVMLGMLCLVWLGTGLVGHDPWKPDEAYSFGLIYSILQGGDWLVPTIAGEPFMDKPPLFYWIAALFAKLASPQLPLHDGARLASGFFSTLTLLFIGLASRKLYGENRGWAAAIILIGSIGMLVRSHEMITDLALLTGCAMMLYGFALSQERHVRAGLLIGTGVGIGFMATDQQPQAADQNEHGEAAMIFAPQFSAGQSGEQQRDRHEKTGGQARGIM